MQSFSADFFQTAFAPAILSAAFRTAKVIPKCGTAFADPSMDACGNPHDSSIVRDVFCDDTSGGNQSISADPMPADNRRIGTDACAFPNRCMKVKLAAALRISAARARHIRKNHGRAAEYIVSKLYSFIDRNIVLNFAVVSDFNTRRNKNILPERAVFPDFAAGTDVAEVPYPCSIANFGAVVDTCGGMNIIPN